MPDQRTAKFSSGDVEIFYRLFGKSGETPIVIVHGLSYFSYDWIPMAAVLASDRQVAAMDMRGFGDSGSAQDYSVPAFARDIIALLDHRGWSAGDSGGPLDGWPQLYLVRGRVPGPRRWAGAGGTGPPGKRREEAAARSAPYRSGGRHARTASLTSMKPCGFFKVDPASPWGVQQAATV